MFPSAFEDFTKIYNQYPKERIGDFNRLLRKYIEVVLQTGNKFSDFENSFNNYRNTREYKSGFIKSLDNFISSWEGYKEKKIEKKKIDVAALMLSAASKYGINYWEDAKKELGDDLWSLISDNGGWSNYCRQTTQNGNKIAAQIQRQLDK